MDKSGPDLPNDLPGMFTTVSAGLVAVLVGLLIAALSLIAGLIAGILHRADGATWPAAIRAGGRGGFVVAGVLLASVGVVIAAWVR
ncbi:hypothetical protein ACG83_32005 [Frankia sp. R43]|nr:hypothetical protein ACG83_32005 [Frankia sp. R43]